MKGHSSESGYTGKTPVLSAPELPKGVSMPKHQGHRTSFTSVREAKYKGKSIRVETTYQITIDDRPVTAHTSVLDNGSVHCHSLPNYVFPSALDLARKIVDASPDEVPEDELNRGSQYGGKS